MNANSLSPPRMVGSLLRGLRKYLPGDEFDGGICIKNETTQLQPEKTPDRNTDDALMKGQSDNGSPSDHDHFRETEYYGHIDDLDDKVNKLLREKESLIRQAEIREREIIDEFGRRANYHKQRVSRLRDQVRDQKITIRELGKQARAHKEKIAKLQAMVIARQESALESLNAGKGPAPMDDHDVESALIRLQESIRSWARNELTWSSLVSKLPISVDKIPAIFVQAALAYVVFEWIFGDPFFLFRQIEHINSNSLCGGLTKIYDQMKLVDEVESHAWRSQMLRMLCLTSVQGAQSFLHGQVESFSSELAQFFLDSSASALLERPGSPLALDHREKELENVLSGAANLALSLWTQRTNMVCSSLYQLQNFWNGDPVAEAHRLHHLDDDDKRLDGTNIVLFVQPAVVAFGSVHGEHYDQSKIWAAATVLVVGKIADTEPEKFIEISSSIKAEEPNQPTESLPKAEKPMKLEERITLGRSIRVEVPVKVESSGSVKRCPKMEDEDTDDLMDINGHTNGASFLRSHMSCCFRTAGSIITEIYFSTDITFSQTFATTVK
ncbi:hypothetical protein BO99DRAFT_471254 [Aspergillus violaceofuscus CBS 115571]|uniref:Uncharacterized protein n=1 Tax=Aspergillus violaceofuscus (strain CBS 115571) TaxID=1450538 RepID=A0A2V5I2N6_ASPV1|nr:hypothetical protein BO99DRAFT_471254 [Aspergillus violaceofuscus CBS 115571]